MRKKSRIEIAREIVSYVRKEMDRPRLTASVRDDLSVQASPDTQRPETRTAYDRRRVERSGLDNGRVGRRSGISTKKPLTMATHLD